MPSEVLAPCDPRGPEGPLCFARPALPSAGSDASDHPLTDSFVTSDVCGYSARVRSALHSPKQAPAAPNSTPCKRAPSQAYQQLPPTGEAFPTGQFYGEHAALTFPLDPDGHQHGLASHGSVFSHLFVASI